MQQEKEIPSKDLNQGIRNYCLTHILNGRKFASTIRRFFCRKALRSGNRLNIKNTK